MRTRLIGLTATLAAVAATAGCGLTGEEPSEPSQRSGRVVVGDKSRQTQSVKCTQTEWALNIYANTNPGSARVALTIGGQKPIVNTVTIENVDGLNGISGGVVGKAEARLDNSSSYTITGTARVTDPAQPSQTTDMPFTIEAPC